MSDTANRAVTAQRRPGRPFEKGKSGNPSGRPKVVAEVQEIARTHTAQAIKALVTIMNSTDISPAARVSAAVAILDRGYGKPAQAISGPNGAPIELVTFDAGKLSDAALKELLALRRAEPK